MAIHNDSQDIFPLQSAARNQYAILFLTLSGFVLRLFKAHEHSYWFDEAREILRAMTPWPDILFVSQGADPPIYRLLLFPVAMVSTDEFWLRLPSVLFSTASIYLIYHWLVLLKQPYLGLFAAVFLTVSPVQIYYAQEVSQYSMVVFLSLLLLIAFELTAKNGRLHNWLWLTLISIISVFTYYGLAWLLPMLDIDLAWRNWKQRDKKRLFGFISFHIFLFISIGLLYKFLLRNHMDRFATNKQLPIRFIDPGLLASLNTIDNELLNRFVRFFAIPFSPTLPTSILYLLATLIVSGGIILLFHNRIRRIPIITIGTIFVMYIASGLGVYPFGGRYALAVTPFFFVLLATIPWALSRWKQMAGWSITAILVIGFSLFWPNLHLFPNPWQSLPRENLRPVMTQMYDQIQSDDFIYVYYGAVPAYQVYKQNDDYSDRLGSWFREWPIQDKLSEIEEFSDESPRLWLIFSHITPGEDDAILAGLTEDGTYQLVTEFHEQNATIILLQQN